MTTIDLIFAEFGPSRANAGDATLPGDRLEPSLSSFKRHFPEANVTVYTDQDWRDTDEYRVKKVAPPFDNSHGRFGNRANDLYDAVGLLESEADVAIAIDSDLVIVSDQVRSLIPLTLRFGLVMPTNSRRLCWVDARSTCDGGQVTDESLGCGPARCTALWSLRTSSAQHRDLLKAYCDQIVDDAKCNRGARGPLSLWRAEWATGIAPFALPNEWCVTGSSLGSKLINGRTVPIILHAGHAATLEHYRDLLEEVERQ